MADERVRVGLIGYGFGGRYFHAPLIVAAPECELAGVVTKSQARRAELAGDHPATPAFGTLAELAASGVDAVAISTPAETHAALVREASGLGLAVLCDKPFAMDALEARDAVAAAQRAGVPLTVYQNRRWDSDFLTVQRVVAEGDLGEVLRFESSFETYQAACPPPSGGGMLRDFGSHLVDQALLLFGPVASVYAEWHVREDCGGVEDRFFAALRHRNGVSSHLRGNWNEPAPGLRFRVTGTEAAYEFAGNDGQADAIMAGRSPADEGDAWGVEPKESWGRLRRGDGGEPVEAERGRWDRFYPAFAAAVRGERPVPVEPSDAVASLEVIDATRASAASGEVVMLDG